MPAGLLQQGRYVLSDVVVPRTFAKIFRVVVVIFQRAMSEFFPGCGFSFMKEGDMGR